MTAPTDEIMRATWRALCRQGYADLTMQDIADESEKSKAALHYHYDSKQDLLEAFLDHVAEQFLGRVRGADPGDGADPTERLSAVLDAAFCPPETDDLEDAQRVLVELKAQAPHESRFREHVRETDGRFRGLIAEIVAEGVDTGAFRSGVDPADAAEFVVLALAGSQLRQVSVGQDRETARDLVETYLRDRVYADREGTTE